MVVKDGRMVGQGYHPRAGEPHAEVWALNDAGPRAKGADLYVNLEPCCHHGRTPPCTDRIKEAGIRRVVVAMTDPNPQVAGRGVRALERSGISVQSGILEKEARRQNEVFLTFMVKKRPFVLWKAASSLDGRTAAKSGHARWVTDSLARSEVHQLRTEMDGILVGSGTVLADDPKLTARPLPPGYTQPAPVLLDGRGRIPLTASVFEDRQGPLYWFVREDVPELDSLPPQVERIPIPSQADALAWILRELARRNITSILLEGGSYTTARFWQERYVDKIRWYLAPKIIGADGIPAVGPLGHESMDSVELLQSVSMEFVGDDVRVEAYPPWHAD